jgi:uncharacterized protein (TIGR04255 family)
VPAANDFLYENAPLVEVIAEFRWDIQRIESLPNAAIDPHFAKFEAEISSRLSGEGFGTIESLVPPNIPIELLANRVLKRFRPQPHKWPVFQIGPGLFTVNMTPPYGGWAKFRRILEKGVDYLLASYPMPEVYLHFRQFELKYIDAFTDRHGFKEMRAFLADYMNINITLPNELWAQASDEGPVLITSEVNLPLREQNGSRGIIRLGSGQANNQNAAVLELAVQRIGSLPDRVAILNWMDGAHSTVRSWFQLLTNQRMKEMMGPVKQLRAP